MKDNLAGRDSLKDKIRLISVVGPTASGKTRLSVELAKRYDGEIISADSMQIYKGMQIATAKPTAEEMQGIPHHLMDFLPPDKTYSVAAFVHDARKAIGGIISRGKLPILVGGTGLYVDSLLNHVHFSDQPTDEQYTAELWKIQETEGTDRLLEMLKKVDKPSFDRLNIERNPKRIIRALAFFQSTGVTMTEQMANSHPEESPYAPVKLGLNFLDREKLYERINKRVDLMMEQGLVEEAREVLNSPLGATAVKAIGYKELAPYFNSEATLEACIEKLKRETRRYAKRQLTWFKRDSEINWLYVDSTNSFDELLQQAVSVIDKG